MTQILLPRSSSSSRVLVLALIISVCFASSAPLKGKVVVPENLSLPPTKIALNGGAYTTLTAVDGSFSFPDVPAGTYLLEVLSPKYYFSQYKISIRPDSAEEEKVLCLEYKYPGAPKAKAAYPLVLLAHSEYQYFDKRDAWGAIRSQLSSPMTWMLLVTVGMAFLFPKILNSLDEEQKKELQGSDPNALLQELLGGGKKTEQQQRK